MSFDLDAILRLAAPDRANPCLVEVARAVHPGDHRVLCWSTGRILAVFSLSGVTIKRRLGVTRLAGGDGDLVLDRGELRALADIAVDWAAQRDRWYAFYFSTGGFPPGYGGAWRYQAAGEEASSIVLREGLGAQPGTGFVGSDEDAPLSRPRSLPSGAEVVAERWRRGERFGPPEGALTGLRYVHGELGVVAERSELEVRARGGSVVLEPGEERFVAALFAVAANRAD
jgi:hypothetical protein